MEIRQIDISIMDEIEQLYKDAEWVTYLDKSGFLRSCYLSSLMSFGCFEDENW